jgi:hypothetical protein
VKILFLTNELTPAGLLAQLLALRTRSSAQTSKFRTLQHNKHLCPRFADQINQMLDVYKRHRTDVHDIQGMRDSGVDVLLRYSTDVESNHKVGIQLKSFREIEDAKRSSSRASFIQIVKSQFAEATQNLGVDEWLLILCTDHVQHYNTVRAICSELKEFEKVKVIEPREALAFYELSSIDMATRISALLCEDDYVLHKARSEVAPISPCGLFMLVQILCQALTGERHLIDKTIFELFSDWEQESGEFILDRDSSEFEEEHALNEGSEDEAEEEHHGDEDDQSGIETEQVDLAEVVEELGSSGLLELNEGGGYAVKPEELPAVCALYFDQLVRFHGGQHEMPQLLYKLLSF